MPMIDRTKKGVQCRFCRVRHMTPTQRGNLIIGSLNLTADNEPKAGAFRQYLRGNAYERRIRPALFRLNIDHVPVFVLCHLAQELLKLTPAFGADLTLQLCEGFFHRLRLSG